MSHTLHMILAFLALIGVAVLLVADEAGPTCNTSWPIQTTLAWDTDCMNSDDGVGSQTGTVTLDVPVYTRDSDRELESEVGETLTRQFNAGGLEVDVSVVYFCDDDGGTADLETAYITFIRNGREVVCEAFSFEEVQEINCKQQSDTSTPEDCRLTLTPQP